MYISLWENSQGHPDNVSFMQFSMRIDGFEQKDSQGFENSYNFYEQYPLEKFFHVHHLPKLYFGFKVHSNFHRCEGLACCIFSFLFLAGQRTPWQILADKIPRQPYRPQPGPE